jgi:tetraprenyl-beta-curcumene synthase
MAPARDLIAVATALGVYRGSIVPRVRRELRRWESLAASIPDPVLREQALLALREKGLNSEATAVFATLTPRASRDAAARAMTAFQVAVDYLDILGEQSSLKPLANGLQLHQALSDALSPDMPVVDWYRLHPQREDGGYLKALVTTCRETISCLPSHSVALPSARHAASRCGEGQSYTHAAAADTGVEELRSWASRQQCRAGYLWWEIAAGASSSVAAHALIAAAADPSTTAAEIGLINAAYFPAIGALTVLLDDLIDLGDDRAVGAHNYMTYYAGNLVAAERLALITERARVAATRLRLAHRHIAILAGVLGFYLSAPVARGRYAAPIRKRMIESFGFEVRPILAAMRLSGRD